MADMPGNPVYNTLPTTPPGWQGVPYMLGPLVADMTGGVARPYVPPNMATFDATMAAQVNNPLYKTMLGNMYSQLGTQIGNTMGNMGFVQSLGTMAGYSPAETQRALQGGMGAFGRSQMGSFVMPLVDSGLNAMGLTGGSFVGMTKAAYDGRMNLMGSGLIDPHNAGQQHQAMAAASATATMLNNIISQRDSQGHLMLNADARTTQGFSRERVTQLAMRAAGMGMFTSGAAQGFGDVIGTGTGGIAERLAQAVGPNIDIAAITSDNFDGKKGGLVGSKEAARKVEAIKKEVERGVQGLTEAMGAMRDLTGYVDEELEQLLTEVTNGDWTKSAQGAFAARDAVRTLHATSQVYNIDPGKALGQIRANRNALQNAAGFDEQMRSLGFNGGGMFGLAAQTDFFANVEDVINAKGVRGDPVAAGRVRTQALQAMSQNMNSQAGRAAQVLAYARQTGMVSDEQASGFAQMLTSGDSGVMGAGLNRLLTTVFGSAEVGRRFMNDSMQMNAMRNSMDDSAGKFAMTMMTNGADAEFRRREQVSAAGQRLAFTQQALSESGMNTWQSAEGTNKVVDNIVATIRGDGSDADRVVDANAFRQQFDAMVAKGMDPRTAANAVVSAYKRSPATSQYAQDIDLAVKRQSAINNEEALVKGGLESRQATALVKELTARGGIDGKESAEIYRLVREGKGAEALARVDSVVSGLDYATRRQMSRVKSTAAQQHRDALETMRSNQEAETLIGLVADRGYGGDDVAKAYEAMASAGLRYAKSDKTEEDYDNFWERVSKSKFVDMFGTDAFKEYMDVAKNGKAVDEDGKEISAVEYFQRMGRRAGAVKRAAVANLGASGYSLGMSDYWSGGQSSVNSQEARERRDTVINNLASRMNEDAFASAGERDSFAANVADFLMGNKNWKSLLKVYGDKDLESSISKYGAAFEKYEKAQNDFNAAQGGYQEAIGALMKSGNFEDVNWVKEVFSHQGEIYVPDLEKSLSGVSGKEGKAAVQKILAAAKARNALTEAQQGTETALGDTVADKDMVQKLKGLTKWEAQRKKRNEKLTGDAKVAAFMEDFDFSEEGIKGAKGADKAWLDKMFAAVSDEEVAAKAGVASSSGVKQKYGEYAMSIVKEKAMAGDEKALEAMKAARVAQRESAGRIHGEITIKSGWDSSPAVLEASIGGLS